MNERIRELLKQAGISMDSFQFSGTPIKHIVDEPSLEKFAELIVQKCADIGERYADGNYEVRNQILSQFGLEEPEE